MSAQILIAVVVGIAAVLAISSGGIAKAKEFFKSSDTDKKPAVEGGSQPARSEASQDQMPLTDKERKTSEQIKKINDGLEIFKTPDDLPRNDSDLTRFDTRINSIDAKKASKTLTPQQQKGAQTVRELAIPNSVKFSTSLAGSVPTTGQQLKREEPVVITNAKSLGGSSALQQKIILEQQRAEVLSKALYGDVQNPKFVKNSKQVSNPKPSTTQRLTNEQVKDQTQKKVQEALEFNRQVIEKKKAGKK